MHNIYSHICLFSFTHHNQVWKWYANEIIFIWKIFTPKKVWKDHTPLWLRSQYSGQWTPRIGRSIQSFLLLFFATPTQAKMVLPKKHGIVFHIGKFYICKIHTCKSHFSYPMCKTETTPKRRNRRKCGSILCMWDDLIRIDMTTIYIINGFIQSSKQRC